MILDNTIIITSQVLILFLLIACGFIARKTSILDSQGLRQITNLLLLVATPCIILKSFQTPFDATLLRGMLIALASGLATHVLSATLSRIVFRGQPETQAKILRFSVVFTNCVFMCVPLLEAVLGSTGVLYGSVYLMIFNAAQWTYGVILMSDRHARINWRQALINPGSVSIVLALPLFLLGIQLPEIPTKAIGYLASMNTPLAMLVIGAQMADISFKSLFQSRMIYRVALLRLIVVPGIVLLVLHLFALDRTLLLACVIPAAAPTAATTALFATRYEQDTGMASRAIAFTTLASIISMPLLITLSDLIGYR